MNNMQNDRQDKFILSPILNILQDTVNACAGISKGIEAQSLAEYVLQTTFLKMTGASEQKLKCICWEMATNDFGYRYQYLKKNYGECSSYADKSSIYKDLVNAITGLDSQFTVDFLFGDVDISPKVEDLINQKILRTQKAQEAKKKKAMAEADLEKMRNGMKAYYARNGLCDKERFHFSRVVLFESIQDTLDAIVKNSLLAQWEQHNYLNFKNGWKKLSDWSFAEGDTLLCKELQDFYTSFVYNHRNRCAHNLKSFQNNLPTLKTLTSEGFVYENYFYRFSILLLLDEIFVRLYKRYVELVGIV